jgi:teichuronic acid biosynthesis glycosyltransferase TuaC
MRILSFSYCFPNRCRPTWGVFVAQRLAAIARRSDVQLEVLAPVPVFPIASRLKGALPPVDDVMYGVKTYYPRFFYVPKVFKYLDAAFYARGLKAWLSRRCRDFKPNILDSHFEWPDAVGVSYLAAELGLPYSITLRGKIYPCLEDARMRCRLAKALQGATAVFSVDNRMAEIAREMGAASDRICVSPNGVDLSHFQPRDRLAARRTLGLPENGRILVTVAHLGERKGHRETIQALAQLPGDVHLVLVGGDDQVSGGEAALRSLANSLGVADRVRFAGRQPYERVPLYFNAADVSVLASWREGCPNVVLESLASGTPVVASDVGGVRAMIRDGHNGRIVPPRQAEPLCGAIQDLLASRPSPEEVHRSPAVRGWDDVAEEVVQFLSGNTRAQRNVDVDPDRTEEHAHRSAGRAGAGEHVALKTRAL